MFQKTYDDSLNPEYVDLIASEAQVLKVVSLKDIPLIILESETWYTGAFSEAEINQIVWDAFQESYKDLCKLSSNCQRVKVLGTDFGTLFRNPAVDKAIQEMYAAVKQP